MRIFLKKFSSAVCDLNEWIGKSTAWLTLFLVLIVFIDVVARKIFNFSKIWIMDLEWHLFALIFLLSAGYTLNQDRHVRVDLFYEKFSVKDKALTNFIGHFLFLIPWCLVVIYFSYGYALESFQVNEQSPEPGGLPFRWIIKFSITIGIFLLLLQAIAGLINDGIALFKKENPDIKSSQSID